MDIKKCKALKEELASQPEPQTVKIDKFFDGNDDLGSIGCNLIEHPGVERFHEILAGLLKRPDVEGVYARISELDPGEGSWPFTDTVFVVGKISAEELRKVVDPLQPDSVSNAEEFGIPENIASKGDLPVLAIWWD